MNDEINFLRENRRTLNPVNVKIAGAKLSLHELIASTELTKIKAIIFDLGGVIMNLDQEKTLRAFKRLGADLDMINLESSIFKDFETGKMNADQFSQGLKGMIQGPLHDELIRNAWNAMMLDVPKDRLNLIRTLKKQFRIYLLSNTNEMHIEYFRNYLRESEVLEEWDDLFDHQFLSYEIGLRKPDKEIYTHVTDTLLLEPENCIFIDDSLANIKGAAKVGYQTVWAREPLNHATMAEIKELVKKG